MHGRKRGLVAGIDAFRMAKAAGTDARGNVVDDVVRMTGGADPFAGKLKEKWGKLTDNDLQRVDGSSEYLAGRLQERYGIARDEAKKQISEFEKSL